MDKDLFHNALIKGFLLVLSADFCYSVQTEDYVDFPEQISAWKGLCVLIPCYEKDNRRINNFLWYQNPEYDDKQKRWTRTVVYDNNDTRKVDSHFEGRVTPYGGKGACGIVLDNVQEGDSGVYRLRTIDGTDLWMTKRNVSLTVSDFGPELMIRPVGVGRESQNLTLSCYINYYCPEMSLSWAGDVRGETNATDPQLESSVKNNKPIMTETEFTFTPTWEDHNKTMQCALTKGDNEVTKTGPVVLNIQYSPKGVRIRPETSPVTISKGEDIALECTAESSNPPIDTYRWYKSANNIVGYNSHYTAGESGTYYCEAENTIGSTRSKGVAINVQYAPTVTLKIPSPEMREGSQYNLTCSVDANPQPENITWYKDYEKILNINRDTLTFPNIRERDSGSYRCEAENVLGSERSADVYVDVVYPPKNPEVVVEPKKSSFVEGSSLRFSCNINSSNPGVSQITWFKNGKELPSERKDYIIIDTIKEEHHGNYTCKATNKIGATPSQAVFINVLYSPKVTLKIPSPEIREGSQYTLTCSVDANPQPVNITWYKDYEKILNINRDALTFPNIREQDSGSYHCEVKNIIGSERSAVVYVDVVYPPKNPEVVVEPKKPSFVEGSSLRFSCNINSSNPGVSQITWYKNGKELPSENKNYIIIDAIKEEDHGNYTCKATNKIGATPSQAVSINVLYGIISTINYIRLSIGIFIVLLIFPIVGFHFRDWKKIKSTDDASEPYYIQMIKVHDYENVKPTNRTQGESPDEIYSTIANLDNHGSSE